MHQNVVVFLFGSILVSFYNPVKSDVMEDMLKAEDTCRVKYTTITKEVVEELKTTLDIAKFQASHSELNCFMTCMGQEMKLVDAEGNLHFENLKEFTQALTSGKMASGDAHAAVSHCAKVSEHDDMCERIGKYAICKVEKLKEHGLMGNR